MTKNEFLLNYRISLLKRAKSINNISKACRELGFSRSVYYKYLKRYLKHGREGLYDKKRAKPVMPNETRKEIVEKILDFVKRYPAYGPVRIANELNSIVCPATVYNILKRNNLNKKAIQTFSIRRYPI
jgi:transposase-like protein